MFQRLDARLGYLIPVNKPSWIKNINIYAGGAYNHIDFKYSYEALYDEPTVSQIFDAIQQPLRIFGAVLDRITPKNIHDWNMVTGIEVELCHNLHCKFEATFLGKQTSLSTGITYRLFGN